MGIGSRIKEILREQGKTIRWLSADSGISVNTLYSITKRDSVRVDTEILKRISRSLGVSLSYLTNLSISYDDKGQIVGAVGYENDLKEFIQAEKKSPHVFQVNKSALAGAIQTTMMNDEFQKLNEFGRERAISYVEELAKNPKYMK